MTLALEENLTWLLGLDGVMHRVARFASFELDANAPEWLHLVLHIVLVIAPFAFIATLGYRLLRLAKHFLGHISGQSADYRLWRVLRSVLKLRWQEQAAVVALGLLAQPLLYASLEIPKRIVNGAIESGHFPVDVIGFQFSQLDILVALSGLYLLTLMLNGMVKYKLNVKKGEIGERTLLHLRFDLYRNWRKTAKCRRRADVIPMATGEIEPIGGFAGDVFATPVFQGGTLLTVLLFMFVQDPILGAAAMTLIPLQILIIPILQARVNERMRRRIKAVRDYGDILGEQVETIVTRDTSNKTRATMHELRNSRLILQRSKFMQKAITNFLMTLTPFLLYSIGGWLVIEGRLSLGALVAVIAAFKDFSAPFRELILYYQNLSDVRLRSDQFNDFLAKCRETEKHNPLRHASAANEYAWGGVAT